MFVYKGYLDESGTRAGSPLTVMGGLLGRAEQWKQFEKQFSQLQAEDMASGCGEKFKRKAGRADVSRRSPRERNPNIITRSVKLSMSHSAGMPSLSCSRIILSASEASAS